jgi:DNA-binding transcriptional LysR family regulator
MDRLLLPHLPAVLAVARTRSFARAAAELGLRPSAVSHAVRAAEERLGAPLFARTTRSVALTEAGDAFMESARRAFEELDAAVERVRAGQREVTGLLRINAPRVALQMGLTPVLLEMARRHPRLTTEIITDDALVDVVEGGFDAGIRLGEMIAQDMVVARLTPPCRAIMVASPSYVSVHGQPASIADLTQHNCIAFVCWHQVQSMTGSCGRTGRRCAPPWRGPCVCQTPPMPANWHWPTLASRMFSNRWFIVIWPGDDWSNCFPKLRSLSPDCSSTFHAGQLGRANYALSLT